MAKNNTEQNASCVLDNVLTNLPLHFTFKIHCKF